MRNLLVLALAMAIPACNAADDPSEALVRRDSAGIEIVEHTSSLDDAPMWRLDGPIVDIGTAEGEGAHALFRVTGATRLSDGRIVVANAGSSELRWFDADGAPLMSAGGAGGGPGEFQRMGRLLLGEGDSVVVYDGGTARVSVFSPEGEYARGLVLGLAEGAPAQLVGLLRGGVMLAQTSVRAEMERMVSQMVSGTHRGQISLVSLSPEGAPLDTLGAFPGAEGYIRIGEGSIEILRGPFYRQPRYVAGQHGVWVATQDAREIDLYQEGALVRRVRFPGEPGPPTPAMVDAWVERSTADAPPEVAVQRAEGLRAIELPGRLPSFGAAIADADGNLWIADFDDGIAPTEAWSVLAPDGRVLARIGLPDGFTPYDAGDDWIIGRALDELDVEHVQLYRILKDGA